MIRNKLLGVLLVFVLFSCKPETCSDGIKNQDETDVDCGGNICNLCPIIYPETGLHGANVLGVSRTSFSTIETSTDSTYSFRCELPQGTSIRIVIRSNYDLYFGPGLANIGWAMNQVSSGWSVNKLDDTKDTQEFSSDSQDLTAKTLEMNFLFFENIDGPIGSAEIDFYENGASQPTFSKSINWN